MARLRLSLYLGKIEQKLGPGKVRLLEAVRETGSISAAAREMGMTYRHAWLLIDELNGRFAEPLVEVKIGGRAGGGAQLTRWGEELCLPSHRGRDGTRDRARPRGARGPTRETSTAQPHARLTDPGGSSQCSRRNSGSVSNQISHEKEVMAQGPAIAEYNDLFIGGEWVASQTTRRIDVLSASTEEAAPCSA